MSDAPATAGVTAAPPRLECVIPILRVTDLKDSLRWYGAVLGFATDWRASGMASVSRDGFSIMLCEGGQGNVGGWVWVGVTDVVPLHAEFAARGAEILLPPTNFSWAHEVRVRDSDGNVLRFGSEPLKDFAFQDGKHP